MPDEIVKHSVGIRADEDGVFHLAGAPKEGVQLRLDPPPDSETGYRVHPQDRKGQHRLEPRRSPLRPRHPGPGDYWTNETTDELRIPIGRTGATKLQYLAIGKGTRQHALIAGKTGSGKSTLFHVMITNLALWCSPDEVEFYLIDFKKGVEFKSYATKQLPHARVIAIESEREFGLSVLQRVDDELKRRGDLFREARCPGHRRLQAQWRATEPMPRTLLMIDEFQEFFVEDDRIAQDAAVLLDRIVRQGRAFGIHVLLGSQTLGGAYTLARTTLGQMVIRIALQCNEADAYLIMDDDNPAPAPPHPPRRSDLQRQRRGGRGEQPVPGRVAARRGAGQIPRRGPGAGAQSSGRTIPGRRSSSRATPPPTCARTRSWPAVLRDRPRMPHPPAPAPGSAHRTRSRARPRLSSTGRAASNLLCVGQRDDAELAMMITAMVSLAAQFPDDGAEFFVLDGTPPGTTDHQFLQDAVKVIPQKLTISTGQDLPEVMGRLGTERKARAENNSSVRNLHLHPRVAEIQKTPPRGRLRFLVRR